MYTELKNEKIIVEISNLLENFERAFDEMDLYCEFMKETFLAGSGKN